MNNSYSIIYDAMLILKQEEMLGQVLALKLGGILLLLARMLAYCHNLSGNHFEYVAIS